MIFAHAFWSKPLYSQKFSKISTSVAVTLLDYAYSVQCVHKFGHTIKLYADKRGIELLKDIPYDEIIELDIDDNTPIHFAASVKFFALQQMDLHEILIDGDIILESSNIFKVIQKSKSDVLYSFFENNEYIQKNANTPEYFTKLLKLINNDKLDYVIPNFNDLEYPNTSLLKFNNQQLKDEYIEQYFRNKSYIESIDFEETWPDIIIEQYFLLGLLEDKNYTHTAIIKNYPNITQYEKDLGFTHLGNQKVQTLKRVQSKLERDNRKLSTALFKKYKEVTQI